MTISTTSNKNNHTANGVATSFAYEYLVLDDTHMEVYFDDVLQSSGYTVIDVGEPAGGTVDFDTAPDADVIVTLLRNVPLTQLVDYTTYDKFPAETHESALDKLTLITQQNAEAIGRAMVAPPSDDGSVDYTLPSAEVLKLMRWNVLADALENVEVSEIGAAVTTAFSRSLLEATVAFEATNILQSGYVAADKTAAVLLTPTTGRKLFVTSADGGEFVGVSGAAPGTYSDNGGDYTGTIFIPTGGDGSAAWIRNFPRAVSAKWFGATGDGTTDDTTALTTWLAYLDSGNFEGTIAGYGEGFLPDGKYKHTSTLTIKAGTKITGIPRRSVFLPTFDADTAIVQETGSTLSNVVIDGLNTTGICLGLDIGETPASATNGYTDTVIVSHFDNIDSIGILVASATYWYFRDVRATDNYDGVHIFESGSTTTPSVVVFDNCEFKSNDHYGLNCEGGSSISFRSCNFELNGDLGARVVAGSGAEPSQITFDNNCWFEANQSNLASGATRNAAYQCLISGKGIRFTDAYFFGNTNQARAINFDDAIDFVFDNCETYNQSATILVSGISTGHFNNWPTGNGEFGTTVNDLANGSYLNDTSFGTFTPVLTFATPGDLSVAYAAQTGRWDRVGRRITLQIFLITSTFTHTTASGNLRISGQPFNAANEADAINVGTLVWGGITKASYTDINGRILSNGSTIDFIASGSAQAPTTVIATDCPTAGTMYLNLTISYEIPN